MKITVTNKADGSVRAHCTGCRDIARETKFGEETMNFGDYDTKDEVIADYNADFDKDTDGWYDVDFAPCVTIK